MLNTYRGCLLGAVLGDALGMPYETLPARRLGRLSAPAFGRAYRGHPNHNLLPGQYTDDGQIILMAARCLKDGTFIDVAHPINFETRAMIEKAVIEAYNQAEVEE